MANIKDYIKYLGNSSFEEVAFNDVDSMIFTQIVYADFGNIIPKDKRKYILFSDAIRLYLKANLTKRIFSRFMREVYDLIYSLKDSKRYANIKMYNYIKIVDHEKQFCGFTLRFNGMVYVAFEGTDTSIIGWKEDFLLASTFPVPAQKFAIKYLNDTVSFLDNYVIVGGHSKGGNLAMTSAMLATPVIRMKIRFVYNFDGPGFRKKEFESNMYKKMEKKLKMFVPEDSTVGMLLLHTSNYNVIKTNVLGLWQHNPLNWECFGGMFIPGNLSSRSLSLEKSNLDFLMSMNESERNQLIYILFSIFERLGITDTTQIKLSKLNQALSLVKELTSIDIDTRKKLITFLKMLIKGV